jgi:hypothetical protein
MPSPRAPLAVVPAPVRSVKPVPKFSYVRSAALLAAVRTLDCQACGRADRTQASHSNWQVHGHGRSIKASDVFIAALCDSCHRRIDQGSDWSEDVRKFVWFEAHRRTVSLLVMLRRWPREIEVPDVDVNPL